MYPTVHFSRRAATFDSADATEGELIEKYFRLIPDNILTYDEWRRLVFDFGINGVQVHDTKLVASMVVHNIQNLITYNVQDFRRFGMINAIHPADAY